MDCSDFEKIYLTDIEWKVLKSLDKKSPQKLIPDIAHAPQMIRLIQAHTTGQGVHKNHSGEYSINSDGRNYVKFRKESERKANSLNLRVWITTFIAIAGFLISLTDLFLNIYQLSKR